MLRMPVTTPGARFPKRLLDIAVHDLAGTKLTGANALLLAMHQKGGSKPSIAHARRSLSEQTGTLNRIEGKTHELLDAHLPTVEGYMVVCVAQRADQAFAL